MIQEENLPKKQTQIRSHDFQNIKSSIYERLMREKIGTKVKIGPKKIEIPYDSEKDLERILEILEIRIEE